MVVTASDAINNVVADSTITVNDTNGATAINCSGPSLDVTVGDGNSDISGPGDSVGFTYTCDADADSITALPASVTFQAGASGTHVKGSQLWGWNLQFSTCCA